MNILVFGGNGFLGRELKGLLGNTTHNFYSASRNKNSNFKIDVSNFYEFANLPIDFFDVIVNCASVLPGGDLLDNDYLNDIYKSNILGIQNICKWVLNQKSIIKLINCSTLAVINKPWDYNLSESAMTYPKGNHVLYCSSKLMQELFIDTFASKYNIDFVNLRFSAIYGENMPKQGVIWSLYLQGVQDGLIKVKNGSNISFDFIYVTDAARIILEVIENKCDKILNAASGNEVTLFQLASFIADNISRKVFVENEDVFDSEVNFSRVSVVNLKKIIDTDNFLPFKVGLKRLINKW